MHRLFLEGISVIVGTTRDTIAARPVGVITSRLNLVRMPFCKEKRESYSR